MILCFMVLFKLIDIFKKGFQTLLSLFVFFEVEEVWWVFTKLSAFCPYLFNFCHLFFFHQLMLIPYYFCDVFHRNTGFRSNGCRTFAISFCRQSLQSSTIIISSQNIKKNQPNCHKLESRLLGGKNSQRYLFPCSIEWKICDIPNTWLKAPFFALTEAKMNKGQGKWPKSFQNSFHCQLFWT